MNDKILQLLVQSGLLINVSDHRVSELDPNIKKFAELIVKECVDIAKGEPASFYDRDAYKLGRKFASEDVLKHFGVEE